MFFVGVGIHSLFKYTPFQNKIFELFTCTQESKGVPPRNFPSLQCVMDKISVSVPGQDLGQPTASECAPESSDEESSEDSYTDIAQPSSSCRPTLSYQKKCMHFSVFVEAV